VDPVRYNVDGQVAILTIDNPPVNALSPAVQRGLGAALDRAEADTDVRAIVIIGARGTFIAGADIKHLLRCAHAGQTASPLLGLLARIEDSPKPIVAALARYALGGGLETALATHYRIASAECQLGQPEVKIGLIPGAGGTQRLPRLAGVEAALEMCAFGQPIAAEHAFRLGLLDQIIEGDLLTSAVGFANDVASTRPIPRTRDRAVEHGPREAVAAAFAAARARAAKNQPLLLAPAAAITAVEGALTWPFREGCERERALFEQLLVSDQAKAMMHIFLAERAVEKLPRSSTSSTIDIRSAAVVGAGTMGRGIAMALANSGIPVRLKEADEEALERGMRTISDLYENSAVKGRLTQDDVRARMNLISPQMNDDGLDEPDILVEAVFEDLQVKRSVFAALDRVAKPGAILATNTSYLDVDAIAAASSRPERVVGLHFFSPAHVMRLVEIVPGRATSPDVVAACRGLVKRLGKLGVIAGNCPGFVGNRMLRTYRRQAQLLLEEGAMPWQVDEALERWGMAMGPFAVQDLAGIDIAMKGRHVFADRDGQDGRRPRVIESLDAAGRYGQKTGAGWYRYVDGRSRRPDREVEALIVRASMETGVTRRTIEDQEIVERAVFALVDEGARILEDECAARASDIDVIYVHGYGFPAFRGGPMQYADSVGLLTVRDRLRHYQQASGDPVRIAPLLEQLAERGGTWAGWDAEREAGISLRAPSPPSPPR
jgi:3-hydroxyacyl-CoA dehydrogenase